MFRAVVFLSVPLFKGTLALMALPYAALGVRAGSQHCTVPAGLELQGAGLNRQLHCGTPGEPANVQRADRLLADDWTKCVFKQDQPNTCLDCV